MREDQSSSINFFEGEGQGRRSGMREDSCSGCASHFVCPAHRPPSSFLERTRQMRDARAGANGGKLKPRLLYPPIIANIPHSAPGI